ncbi:hypothetical protein [Streptomyces tubercidicus]|uniref:hypothetical protein n=1 Tax=Streptomyces tubercidicus TaxID=47759 RepID=UPI002E0DF7DE|nr:hypothetical protein OG761_29470 [Streptomyces tubercidicus]WSX19743.1 hypothetical protein OG690_07905 [Streptomyces tubercidicus]
MKNEHALVIGGGGVAGIALGNGRAGGLADAGVDVTDADFLFGTMDATKSAARRRRSP